jgi:hypothetical protein
LHTSQQTLLVLLSQVAAALPSQVEATRKPTPLQAISLANLDFSGLQINEEQNEKPLQSFASPNRIRLS